MKMQSGKDSPFGWAFWLFISIFIGVSQSYPEILMAIEEGGLDYSIYLGPIWIKLMKDVLVVLLWFYLVLVVRDPFPRAVLRAVTGCYAVVILSFSLAVFWFSPLLAFAGLRWIIPVFIFLELRRLCGRVSNVNFIVTTLFILLFFHLALQGLRLFSFPNIWGERWGLSARPPGFFLLPNTSAFFATACAALVIDLKGRKNYISYIFILLSTLSAFISLSAGGLLACLALIAYSQFRRLMFAVPVLVAGMFLFLSASSFYLGREGFLEYSAGYRIAKLLTAADEISGPGAFGAYTSTGFMLILSGDVASGAEQEPIISDSFYASLIGNFGFFVIPFVIFFWIALRRAYKYLLKHNVRFGQASLLCIVIFGFSTVVSEAFPMIIMLSIGVWMGSNIESAHLSRKASPLMKDLSDYER